MKIVYQKDEKITKKNDTKEPVSVTEEGFVDDNGEVTSYWKFFKSFGDALINVAVTYSVKTELEDDTDTEG